jgi:hypothetical protein
VSNKIKIGERGFEAPFRYDENKKAIVDANGQNFCFPTCVITHDVPVIGAFIVSALNNREEKEAAILKEREEIIAMLTDGSYCRASEHKRNICVCPEFRADIRARSIPE